MNVCGRLMRVQRHPSPLYDMQMTTTVPLRPHLPEPDFLFLPYPQSQHLMQMKPILCSIPCQRTFGPLRLDAKSSTHNSVRLWPYFNPLLSLIYTYRQRQCYAEQWGAIPILLQAPFREDTVSVD